MPVGGNNRTVPSFASIARSQTGRSNVGSSRLGPTPQGYGTGLRHQLYPNAPGGTTPQPNTTAAANIGGPTNVQTSGPAIMAAPVWNPSIDPSPSIMPTNGQKIPTTVSCAMSNISQAQPATANQVCKTYARGAKHFLLGEIISLPFHEANTNPGLQPTDHRLRLTWQGPVFTKRRMLVILWKNQRDMFCLPLYSFEGRGLVSKPAYIKSEYVCMRNSDRDPRTFPNQGNYPPLVAQWNLKPFSDETAVHITGGIKVSCNEDIAFCGRLDQNSYYDLLGLWEQLAVNAKREPY